MKQKEQIILIGGGGHCKACIDVIEAEGRYTIAGIVDFPEKIGQKICGYKIIASDNDISALAKDYKNFAITIGQLKSSQIRRKIADLLKGSDVNFPVIISPTATVSKHASIDEGTIIMHNTVVNADAKIGKHNIINTGAIIEHDVIVGDFNHISINSTIGGTVKIANDSFIGGGSFLYNNVKLADGIIVSAGSVVSRDYFEKDLILRGNPARPIKR